MLNPGTRHQLLQIICSVQHYESLAITLRHWISLKFCGFPVHGPGGTLTTSLLVFIPTCRICTKNTRSTSWQPLSNMCKQEAFLVPCEHTNFVPKGLLWHFEPSPRHYNRTYSKIPWQTCKVSTQSKDDEPASHSYMSKDLPSQQKLAATLLISCYLHMQGLIGNQKMSYISTLAIILVLYFLQYNFMLLMYTVGQQNQTQHHTF